MLQTAGPSEEGRRRPAVTTSEIKHAAGNAATGSGSFKAVM
jgi:hypothetical protein